MLTDTLSLSNKCKPYGKKSIAIFTSMHFETYGKIFPSNACEKGVFVKGILIRFLKVSQVQPGALLNDR